MKQIPCKINIVRVWIEIREIKMFRWTVILEMGAQGSMSQLFLATRSNYQPI